MSEHIVLDARLDLGASERLIAQLASLRGRDVAFDASEVVHLGAHAAQTLLVARASWRRDGIALTIASPSADFLSDWADLGLGAEDLSGLEPAE